MERIRFHCPNRGCSASFSTPFGLSKHRCRFERRVRAAHRFPPISNNNARVSTESEINVSTEPEVGISEPEPIIITESPRDNAEDESNCEMNALLDYCNLFSECSDMKPESLFRSIHTILSNPDFNIEKFRKNLPTLDACQQLVNTQFEQAACREGFEKGEVFYHDGASKHSATLFYKDAIQCIHNQLLLCTEDDLVLPPNEKLTSNSETQRHPLRTPFFKEKYRNLKLSIMGSKDKGVIWNDSGDRKSIIGFIQLFTDKTVAALKTNSFSAHAVHITLVNFTKAFRKRMIQEGHTVLGFLPVAVDKSVLEAPAASTGTEHPINYSLLQRIEREEHTDINDCLHGDNEAAEIVSLSERVRLTSEPKGRHIKQEIIYKLSLIHISEPTRPY